MSRFRTSALSSSRPRSFTPDQLKSEIQTETVGFLRDGRLDDELLINDASALIRFYQDRGYLDVRVQSDPPRISPNGREAIVTFLVEEGPRYTLRNIQVYYPRIEQRFFDTANSQRQTPRQVKRSSRSHRPATRSSAPSPIPLPRSAGSSRSSGGTSSPSRRVRQG